MYITLGIAIQPFLKKYISYYHSTDPFKITGTNQFGSYLISILEHPTQEELALLRKMDKKHLCDSLRIGVSEWMWTNHGHLVSAENQVRFNAFTKMHYYDRMWDWMADRVDKKGSMNRAFMTFRDKYGITEDELPLKTIQKHYERLRESVKYSLSA